MCFEWIENIIYGWELDSKTPIFQLSRHKEKITDFLALDHHNLFATCSLDKRIVLWSQSTRRVKGVLRGHKRGIKVMSYAKDSLLTAGFESEAIAWDLNLHEASFYLRGHRLPLADVKLMVRPGAQGDDLRAITVDDGGEFRLWSISGREKGSGAQLAITLQTFSQAAQAEQTLSKVRFLVVPYNTTFSNGKYSDFVAASNRLLHFKPQKISVDFYPPMFMAYSDAHSCIVTAVGKHLYKYDISNGAYHSTIADIGTSEVTHFLLDGEHGRRIFVGTANGALYLINFASGQVIGMVQAHSKEVLCLSTLTIKKEGSTESDTIIYSGSTDGNIRQIKESSGSMEITHTIENAMGNHRRLIILKAIPEFKSLLCIALKHWAIYCLSAMRRNFLFKEKNEITGFELLGGGGRYDKAHVKNYEEAVRIESERVLSIALCTTAEIKIYALDVTRCSVVLTHTLGHSCPLHFSSVCKISFPKTTSVNYLSVKHQSLSLCLVAASDEGFITLWDAKSLRLESLSIFYKTVPDFLANLDLKAPLVKTKSKPTTLMRAAQLLRRGKSGAFGSLKKMSSQSVSREAREASYAVPPSTTTAATPAAAAATTTASAKKKDVVGLGVDNKATAFTSLTGEEAEHKEKEKEKVKEEVGTQRQDLEWCTLQPRWR